MGADVQELATGAGAGAEVAKVPFASSSGRAVAGATFFGEAAFLAGAAFFFAGAFLAAGFLADVLISLLCWVYLL